MIDPAGSKNTDTNIDIINSGLIEFINTEQGSTNLSLPIEMGNVATTPCQLPHLPLSLTVLNSKATDFLNKTVDDGPQDVTHSTTQVSYQTCIKESSVSQSSNIAHTVTPSAGRTTSNPSYIPNKYIVKLCTTTTSVNTTVRPSPGRILPLIKSTDQPGKSEMICSSSTSGSMTRTSNRIAEKRKGLSLSQPESNNTKVKKTL